MSSKLTKAKLFITLLWFCVLGTQILWAADSIDFEITGDYFGKYIWRGQNLSDDPVFQPGFNLSLDNFSIGVWGSMDTTNINGNSGDYSEVDYWLDYSSDLPGFEGLDYSLGVIYYDFPGTVAKDTTELYWGLSFDLPFSPSITVYHDVDEAQGSYFSLSAEHRIKEIARLGTEPIGLNVAVSSGWANGSYNKYYWGTDQSKMQDLSVSVAFPIEIADWAITPNLTYVTLLSDDIRDTDAYGTDSDFFFVGISLSKEF